MSITIKQLFEVLKASGIREPKVYETDVGLSAGLMAFGKILEDLSPGEVEASALAYAAGTNPFWPTPGVLLSLVDHYEESWASWGRVMLGESPNRSTSQRAKPPRPTALEQNIIARVGLDDGRRYRQAYRHARRRYLELPHSERRVLDDKGHPIPGRLPDAVFSALPPLLTMNKEG